MRYITVARVLKRRISTQLLPDEISTNVNRLLHV